MRRMTMIALVAAVLGGVAAVAPGPAQAAPAIALGGAAEGAVQAVRYDGPRHHRGWDRRGHWHGPRHGHWHRPRWEHRGPHWSARERAHRRA